jgi:hypothetical protein
MTLVANCSRCGQPLTTSGPVCSICLDSPSLFTMDKPTYCLRVIGLLISGELPSKDDRSFAEDALRARPTLDQALKDLREHYFGDHRRVATMAERERILGIVNDLRRCNTGGDNAEASWYDAACEEICAEIIEVDPA